MWRKIEKGNFEGEETEKILRNALEPMIKQGVDTVVMGCTHYPFVIPLIQKITGPTVKVIDPAPAIARQVQRMLDARGWLPEAITLAGVEFITTGDVKEFTRLLPYFSKEPANIRNAAWTNDSLTMAVNR